MCVTAQTPFSFACIVLTKRWETLSRASVMAIGSWLTYQGTVMNKDQVKGRIEEVEGKAKEVVGKILDDGELEIKGNVQKNVGKVRAGMGDLKEDIKKHR